MSRLIKILIVLSVSGAMAWAQTAEQNPQASPAPNAPAPGAAAAVRPDPAKQMQLDLDQMESLVNNMAAQVSFIRDTNMSILLNTNVRLWTVLIRDLRMQMQEQQRHAASENSNSPQRR
ncbi:MAG: hypothetical protein WAM71_09610 [Candidatus Korobacteraceae bacterium]